jgi:hypothetical protein
MTGQRGREAVAQAIARLQQVTTVTVNTLEAILIGPTARESAKVTPARAVLEFAIQGVELEDLEVRIAALEQRVAELNVCSKADPRWPEVPNATWCSGTDGSGRFV